VDEKAVAILHQGVRGVGELGLLTETFSRQSSLGIRGRDVQGGARGCG
jgi:hypothetical protein